MTDNTQTGMTLVTGGTGKTGRRVVRRLQALGAPVRAGSRGGTPPFDWEDRDTWAPALSGVESVYLSYYPDLAAPGAAETVRAFTDVAVSAGVRRLVLLSGRGEPEAQRCERIVAASGLEWTVVRASVFSQNFSEHFLREPVLAGVVAFPAGDVAEPFVDVDDIADVAVAALTVDGHAGQEYEVTGPRLVTFAEAIAEIAAATGRQVRYLPVSPEAYVSALVNEAGVPAEFASFLGDLFGTIFDGRNAHLSDGVERALGRKPRDFTDYVREAAAAGAWAAQDGRP
jgi:uncharacterized protein YbjT (DUF2867 family)